MSENTLEWCVFDFRNWWRRPWPRVLFSAQGDEVCGAVHPETFICTRPTGHGGRHVATAGSVHEVCAVWRQP